MNQTCNTLQKIFVGDILENILCLSEFRKWSSIKMCDSVLPSMLLIFEVSHCYNHFNRYKLAFQCTHFSAVNKENEIWKEMPSNLPVLGFYAHTEPVPSQVFRFLYCHLLQLAGNSNHYWDTHTENRFCMIFHRWVTFIAGVYVYTRVAESNLYPLRHNTDALPL